VRLELSLLIAELQVYTVKMCRRVFKLFCDNRMAKVLHQNRILAIVYRGAYIIVTIH